MIFNCHHYSDEKKINLAAIEFTDYAMIWWDQLVTTRRRNYERPVQTWGELKGLMRKRFIPSHYYRQLYQNLQHLYQCTKSVEEYYTEMEVAMIRANVVEDAEATMARFLGGLNREIANVVELHHYVDLEDMLHMAIKVERQLKKKATSRFGTQTTSTWKGKWVPNEKRDGGFNKPRGDFSGGFNKPRAEPSGKGKEAAESSKPRPKPEGTATRTKDVKCFKCLGMGHYSSQCPNRRTLVIDKKSGEVHSTDSEVEFDDDEPEIEDTSDKEGAAYPLDNLSLVVKRVLSAQIIEDESDQQRENIFHTRCRVNGKGCSMIIDGGSCANIASTALVERLGLDCLRHPKPYKLQWLNDCGEIKVTKQVLLSFTIGPYTDDVLCDVIPMHTGHILLGRPWQFDRKVIHDEFKNKYSFQHKGKPITLYPLTPKQVHEDQVKLQLERD